MLSYKESLKILKETNALLEGHFILSSGLRSNQYIQCAKLMSHPDKAKIFCSSLSDKIKKSFENIDIILAPAMGAIIVGYEIGRQLNIETIFAERVEKNLVIRRGFQIPENSNVLVIEDVITTGKSALECTKIIKSNKANLVGFACLIDRSSEDVLIKDNIVSQIKFEIKTFKETEIPDEIKIIPAQKPGSRKLS